MKLIFGINTYKDPSDLNVRQKLCIKSLKKICSENNSIVNLQFNSDSFEYKDFNKTLKLQQSSQDYISHSSYKFPIVSEIFDVLSNEDCDYFVFLNDDIIIQKNFLKEIEDFDYDCYITSRVDINLHENGECYTPVNYNIHGFDLFCIKKEWWLKNRDKFPPLILGKYFWDTAYYVLCKKYGKTKTLNKLPYSILHPIHNGDSNHQTKEHFYNQSTVDLKIIQSWFYVANNILTNRLDDKGIKNSLPTLNEEINSDLYLKENL